MLAKDVVDRCQIITWQNNILKVKITIFTTKQVSCLDYGDEIS